ncbi:hypothetical protein I302_104726 [Kwoniella bestiolae CBS 10118]|uniref:Uncharacterized protein n=1 Tax=Kwoniella bestiolae CBS 10118 TaxID=1296100 RepID=A0A1B9FRX6_9TREE|nr:hypothetical protein I302_09203 [Kwoniella bestiolae CBS 10118]OCF21524.1 hypothetical protein I302_09203 [Kwoniella bestiolae CBS 10118]
MVSPPSRHPSVPHSQLKYTLIDLSDMKGACHSTRAHPHPHPSTRQTHSRPHSHATPHYPRPHNPSIIVLPQPPVTINSTPRRRRTGKVVVKAVECTPSERTTTRTYVEYGGKQARGSGGVRF